MLDRYQALDEWVDGVSIQTGATLLDSVYEFLGRFVAYPSEHSHVAHTLWIAHTHAMSAWESTPRIAFLSPEPGSGKTRALEISETLVPRPVEAVSATPAYLFRKVSQDPDGLPTILFDEIDTIFGPRSKRDNEEIRGMLNAGHRRGATAGRCVIKGKVIETEELPAYCAVALAGLGHLPDTILSRSIIVRMRRRAPHEQIEPYRRRIHAAEGYALRDRLAEWVEAIVDDLSRAWPDLPGGIEDRNADVWEPLLAMADSAGGSWPDTAREAAVALVALAKGESPSLGIRLLTDIHSVFGNSESLSTEDLLHRLVELEEAPWADLRGKPLNARGLANYLRQYEVSSRNVRENEGKVLKGYTKEGFWDVWQRYLPKAVGEAPQESATSATAAKNVAGCPTTQETTEVLAAAGVRAP